MSPIPPGGENLFFDHFRLPTARGRVHFGSLDSLNNRYTFNSRSLNEFPDLSRISPQPPSETPQTPPITLTSPNTSPSGRIYIHSQELIGVEDIGPIFESKTLPRADEKPDQFHESKQEISTWEMVARLSKIRSFSVPNSVQGSPVCNAVNTGYSVEVQGEASVDDVTLLDLQESFGTADVSQNSTDRSNTTVAKEACDLVRQHTQMGTRQLQACVEPRSGAVTPIAHQHEDYVQPPEKYRGGILSSLLKLYNPAHHGGLHNRPHYGYSSSTTGIGTVSPQASGRATPKWHNKSANTSTTSLSGLLVASGSALATPAAGIYGENVRLKAQKRSVLGANKDLEDEIKITIHIAETLARQRYILKLCRALMLYGAPTHRLEEYMKMTSRVLEIDGQFLYIPGCMIVSFGDSSTHTSDMQIVRTNQGVDLGKLHDTHIIYKGVVHDIIGVEEATQRLSEVMYKKSKHNPWSLVPIYGIASAVVGPFGFKARLIDMPVLFLLGCILGVLELIVAPSSELYSNVFEISAAILTSFLSRAFGSIGGGSVFCFSALAQSSIALILPGYIILCGSLELQSKNIVAGSVRMFYAIIYSLFLGFGITIGSALYGLLDQKATSATTCENPLSLEWNFLFVPPFALCLLIINQAHWKQAPVMVAIAMAGYIVNFFCSQRFSSQPQVSNSMGAFTIGVLGNLYSRVGHGLAFAAMLPAIFVQVPSGLAAQGSLVSGIQNADSLINNITAPHLGQYNSMVMDLGFSMIQIAIGISVGLFAAALVVYPFGKKRSGLFSF